MCTCHPRSDLTLHPLARPAFDAYAALGDLGLRGAPIRAVRADGALLAFAGFARLRGDPAERITMYIVDGLSSAQIRAAA